MKEVKVLLVDDETGEVLETVPCIIRTYGRPESLGLGLGYLCEEVIYEKPITVLEGQSIREEK